MQEESSLLVEKIDVENIKAGEVSELLNKYRVGFEAIDKVNWKEFAYRPETKFRIAHNGKNILLNYQVDEADIKALCDYDNGEVCKDSCVEFFVSFDKDAPYYYNIEANCIGSILIAGRIERNNKERADEKLIAKIDRWSSLGRDVITEEGRSGKWELSLVIPFEVFFKSGIDDFTGLEARANFYKCGDKLSQPHYLSWKEIKSEHPNFHQPDFFGNIRFE